jgi:hypothetical protein
MAELLHDTGWRLGWRGLSGVDRWHWWDQLWKDAVELRDRYRLPLRSGWWRDDVQVEALAAIAAFADGYDTGSWNDPVAKLQLLQQLDNIRGLMRDGEDVFDPDRHRDAFMQHLVTIGCEAPKQPTRPRNGA